MTSDGHALVMLPTLGLLSDHIQTIGADRYSYCADFLVLAPAAALGLHALCSADAGVGVKEKSNPSTGVGVEEKMTTSRSFGWGVQARRALAALAVGALLYANANASRAQLQRWRTNEALADDMIEQSRGLDPVPMVHRAIAVVESDPSKAIELLLRVQSHTPHPKVRPRPNPNMARPRPNPNPNPIMDRPRPNPSPNPTPSPNPNPEPHPKGVAQPSARVQAAGRARVRAAAQRVSRAERPRALRRRLWRGASAAAQGRGEQPRRDGPRQGERGPRQRAPGASDASGPAPQPKGYGGEIAGDGGEIARDPRVWGAALGRQRHGLAGR